MARGEAKRIADYANPKEIENMPEKLRMTRKQFRDFLPVWLMYVKTGRKHKLSDLVNEPTELYDVVFEIDNVYQTALSNAKKQMEQSNG